MKKFFNDVTTLDELKAAYRRLAMENHPDRGGSNEIMQAINREHDELFNSLKAEFNKSAAVKSTETPEEFRNIIIELLKFDGLNIELCGRWLWIGGNTYAYKAQLKELGCKWAAKKKLWSWHHEEDGSIHYRGKASMDEIRSKYGSDVFTNSKVYALA